jgi:hypothetical protein
MINVIVVILLNLVFVISLSGQTRTQTSNLLTESDLNYLEDLTKDVVESSRIHPGQMIPGKPEFGSNNSGGTLIRPGGRDCYPSFWIRDYAMSLESGFITTEEQKHMLFLTASKQCDQTWITKGGSMVPFGAIADHIRINDSMPVYFPGTYSYDGQGEKKWGMFPPYDDQFFFIHMAYNLIKSTSDFKLLFYEINGLQLIDRLEIAFKVPPARMNNHIVYCTDNQRGVDFGFRDAVVITGDLCFSSILKFRASNELSELFEMINNKAKAENYRAISAKIKNALPEVFLDKRGMLLASNGKSRQADVWGTALAVYLNILEGANSERACRFLADAYKKGNLSFDGNIRHILNCDDFNDSTAWEVTLMGKNTYQNGAYWGTPTGWVCYAISNVDYAVARKLAKEYIEDLRKGDFRKGDEFGSPYECFHPSGNKQNPVYMTSVTCPYEVFMSMKVRNKMVKPF